MYVNPKTMLYKVDFNHMFNWENSELRSEVFDSSLNWVAETFIQNCLLGLMGIEAKKNMANIFDDNKFLRWI